MKLNYYKTKRNDHSFKVSALLVIAFILITTSVNSQSQSGGFEPPIVITKGGTYSGNWESKDSNVSAVKINTSEEVIIENSTIKGAGNLIYSNKYNCNVIIRNTKGYGLTPSVDNKSRGRFFFGYEVQKVIIENNYMEGTAGIFIESFTGNSTQNETIRVRYNKAKNIDGRFRNGGRSLVQFLILNKIKNVKNIEVAWNEVINMPNHSAVEDNINIHRSSGTSTSPIKIHNNFIQGAYPLDLSATKYSGGGIMLADGSNGTADEVSSYVTAYENQVVSTTNYGIAIAGGNNNLAYNNRVVASGLVNFNGTTVALPAQNVGIYILNVTNTSASAFYNNSARENYVGFVNMNVNNKRNDYYLKQGVNCTNNKSISGSVTAELEKSEYELWKTKVELAGKRIGLTDANSSPDVVLSPAKLKIYPNPVKKYLTIESEGLEIKTLVSIWSSAGNLIVANEEFDSFNQKAVIDLEKYNLSKGLFFVRIQNGDKIYEERVLMD